MDGRYQQFQYRETSFVWPEFLMIKEILGNIFYNLKIFQLLNIISFISFANDQSFNAFPQRELSRKYRIYKYLDTKAFVSVPLKQGCRSVQRHSLCLSADAPSSAVFFGW
jgi:hypothetical protein